MVRTNSIAELLSRPTHVRDADFELLARVAKLAARPGPPDPWLGMRWLRKHTAAFGRIPECRVWLCGVVEWAGAPCALVQAAGKRDDEDLLHVFDAAAYERAVRALTGRWLVRAPRAVGPRWRLADAGIQYGMCVDCDWPSTWLDVSATELCAACSASQAAWRGRTGARESDGVRPYGRRRLGRRGLAWPEDS